MRELIIVLTLLIISAYEAVAQGAAVPADSGAVSKDGTRKKPLDSLLLQGEIKNREYSTRPVEVFGSSVLSKFNDLNSFNSTINSGSRALELSPTAARSFSLLPGVSVGSLGSAIEKPVVRGQNSARVIALQDNMPTSDFAGAGADHQITADATMANKIELLRGPAALKYAGNTLTGALNIDKDIYAFETPKDFFVNAQARYGDASASKAIIVSAGDAFGSYSTKADFNIQNGANLRARTRVVPNTAFDSKEVTLGGSNSSENFKLGGAFNYSSNDYGVPGGVVGLHPNGADIEMRNYTARVKSVAHFHKPLLDNVDLELSRSFYRHKEFESNGSLGALFQRTDYRAAANFNQMGEDAVKNSTLGVTAQFGQLRYGGYVFAPPVDYFSGAAYFFQDIEFDKVFFQYAVRFGYDRLNPLDNVNGASLKTFPTLAASVSVMKEVASSVFVGGNLSRSSRAPSADELFNRGPHLAAYTYNIGNSGLKSETALGFEGFAFYRNENAFAELRAFYFDYDSYILHSFTGDTNYTKLLPIYKTANVPAVIAGGELSALLSISKSLEMSGNLAYVQGKRKTGNYLPLTPPLNGKLGLIYSYKAAKFELETSYALRQGKTDDFEPPTPGYVLLNSTIGVAAVGSGYVHNFALRVENILNVKWRNHLSLLKDILPEPGINFFLTYSLFFEKGERPLL